MNNKYKVVIIGCGVAGMTAALYLNRAGIDCIILEKSMPGGQIVDNGNIMNFPTYESISGSDLAIKMLKQITDLGVSVKYEEVTEIKIDKEKKVITKNGEYNCDYVIIATGRKPKLLGVKGEDELRTKGISYCAVCDGALYKNKDVVVVGASDAAFEGAIYLSKLVSSVTVLYRNEFRAKAYLQDMIKKIDNISFVKGEVESFSKDDRITIKTKNSGDIITDGVFIYIGQIPNASFLEPLNVLDDRGYIKTDNNLMTSIDGVYAVGDALKKFDYQIVIAMGEAARVALEISRR